MVNNKRIVMHIDFNSYFAAVEQQANPKFRGKPVGVTGGDRMERTVLGAASVEAKKLGIKTGMQVWEAKRICPQIIIVKGDHNKYLNVTTKFLNILKDYSPYLEVFSIDECFLELCGGPVGLYPQPMSSVVPLPAGTRWGSPAPATPFCFLSAVGIALDIKKKIKSEIGEWITCSIGISYNKLMAKLAGSLQKPDGLVVIPDTKTAIKVLDSVELDEICGIGPRIKKRLFNMGIRNFKTLRQVPKELLLASFKSYGEILYNMARGIDARPIVHFYEKEPVKSIGQRHTLNCDTNDIQEIRQVLLKICELVAQEMRSKKIAGKTIHLGYRLATTLDRQFLGGGQQQTLGHCSSDGWEIFQTAWHIFNGLWQGEKIRMVGISVSGLKPKLPSNLTLLPEEKRREIILNTLDKINNKFGDFTLKRAVLLKSAALSRKPNSFLADKRFKI